MLSKEKKIINIPSELKSMIPGFLSRREDDLKQIQSFFKKKKMEEISRIGHKLKGNGLSYGFGGLSAIGKEIEEASKANDLKKTQSSMLELEEYLKYVKTLNLGIESKEKDLFKKIEFKNV